MDAAVDFARASGRISNSPGAEFGVGAVSISVVLVFYCGESVWPKRFGGR